MCSLRDQHRSIRLTVLLLAVLAMVGVLPPSAAHAAIDASAEQRFLDSVNAERAKRGLDRLRPADDLRSVARRHSVRMADQQRLHHNPNLATDVKGWTRLAENVGRGPSVSRIHGLLMDSSGHRANILDRRVSEVGIGVEVRGSSLWVTQVFRAPTSPSPIRFRDVSSSSTHAKAITRLGKSAITVGCAADRYCPDRAVTRAEMASFLARSGALLPRDGSRFEDLIAGSMHEPNVEAIARARITTGCTKDRYCPSRSVTRAEMATFLARAKGLELGNGRTRYADVTRGSTHAAAIEAIAVAGITHGCGGDRYCPDRPVTRAEMASFLVRAFAP